MSKARARHILVKTRIQAADLKEQLAAGADFAALAKQYSKCPSSEKGGDLGSFEQGQMVPEFDEVIFKDEIGQVHGPVKTQFGYHLIDILERS